MDIGMRYSKANTMEVIPTVTQRIRRPEDAWESVAPTAWRPAITRAKEVANPAMEPTIPAEMG